MNKHSRIAVVILLLIGLLLIGYIIIKPKEVKLEEVKLKENKINNKQFAIMIENNEGEYEEYKINNEVVSTFPTGSEYIYNNELSGCIDDNGELVENVLTYNETTQDITVEIGSTVYCYVYFDLDTTAPVITLISDNGSFAASVTVTENESGVDSVCINTSSTDTSECTWKSVSGTTFTTNTVSTTGTYYVHVKDAAGNIGHSSGVTITTGISGTDLIQSGKTGLNTSMTGGLYRFYGTSVDNYICFGTTNQSDCINNTDKYMYRIIGIDSEGKMKLIKKEALDTKYKWHSSSSTNTTWPNSDLYNGLNGSYFLSNTTYVPDSTWSDRIASVSWKYGDTTSDVNYKGNTFYSIENGWTDTIPAKIGLQYLHDYYYAYNATGDPGSADNAKTAWIWLFKSGNDSSLNSNSSNMYWEWLISRYGYASSMTSGYCSYYIDNGGKSAASVLFTVAWDAFVRPVFYLTSNQRIVDGSGTLADPYYLS